MKKIIIAPEQSAPSACRAKQQPRVSDKTAEYYRQPLNSGRRNLFVYSSVIRENETSRAISIRSIITIYIGLLLALMLLCVPMRFHRLLGAPILFRGRYETLYSYATPEGKSPPRYSDSTLTY